MSGGLIRPELAARLRPWREVLAAVAVGLGGAWIASWGGLFFQPLGLAILAVAAVWGVGARRRMVSDVRTAPSSNHPDRVSGP